MIKYAHWENQGNYDIAKKSIEDMRKKRKQNEEENDPYTDCYRCGTNVEKVYSYRRSGNKWICHKCNYELDNKTVRGHE